MTLVDGNGLSTWEGGLFDQNNESSVSLLYRLLWIFTQARGEGMGIELNEAGRPFGEYSDINVGRNRQPASATASGRSTVCYQYGRYLLYVATNGREGTPSAANPYSGPYASNHTKGFAADIDSNNYGRLDQLAERVGMKRTISSEIWHYEIYRDPDSDIDFSPFSPVIDAVFGRTSPAGGNIKPIDNRTAEEKEWDIIMTGAADIVASLDKLAGLLTRPQDDATKTAAIVRNYSAEKGTNVATAVIFPDASAVRLTEAVDVTAIEVAMVQVYGILPTGWDNADVATRYPGQLSDAQWRNFWQIYPGPMTGFKDEDFLAGKRPTGADGHPKGTKNN